MRRFNSMLAALGGALCLTSCASDNDRPRHVTQMPDRIEYGRRMTISYALSNTMLDIRDSSGCSTIDKSVIERRDYNSLYFAQGVVHSDRDRAIDTFIADELSVCRAAPNAAEDYRLNSLLLVRYTPLANGGYLQIGPEANVTPMEAFILAADMAARTNPDNMWQDAFQCRRDFVFQRNAAGEPTGLTLGNVNCTLTLSRDDEVPPPRPNPLGPNELRSRQPD